jgi:hypothetical protein
MGLSVSRDGLDKYLKDSGLAFPVYTDPYDSKGTQFPLDSTPQTLVIGPDAKLQEAWLGAYGPPLQKEIEAKLNVRLPGLSPDAGTPPPPSAMATPQL